MTRLRNFHFLAATLLSATLTCLVLSYFLFSPEPTVSWILAFATLLFLAVASALLALRITEGGASTSIEFLPQLAAIPLLGPFGAIALTVLTQLLSEFLILKKDRAKAFFNTGLFGTSISAASFLYVGFGATASLTDLPFEYTFPPFLVAVVGYFVINTVFAAYAISLLETQGWYATWQLIAGRTIFFDLVMSALAYLVAFLYVQWGPVALLAIIIPLIGLRYSYGVNIQLQELNQDLLRVLIKTLEARDRYTSGHSIRVAERTKKIAQAYNLRYRQIQLIENAALLHDIGKIDLAYGEILRQAGPLTAAQRELIRAHPDKGVEILKAVRSIDPEILRCVRHHHEWYDGSGYPSGLAGDEIPIGARLIMISDSIDAMLTDRPYRAALSVDDVRQELIRNSGTQFDPVLVQVALRIGILEEEPILTAPALGQYRAHRRTSSAAP